MSKLVALITVFVLVFSTGSSHAGDFSLPGLLNKIQNKMTPEYEKINHWLMEHVEEDESLPNNAIKAREYFESASQTMKDIDRKAWQQFVDLVPMATQACKPESVELLGKNVEDARVNRKDPQAPPFRIQKVVLYFARAHAKACQYVYQTSYDNWKHEMSQSDRDFTLHLVVNWHKLGLGIEDTDTFVFRPDSPRVKSFFVVLSTALVENGLVGKGIIHTYKIRGSPEEKAKLKGTVDKTTKQKTFDQEAIKEMVKHTFELCKKYLNTFEELVNVAAFDAITADSDIYVGNDFSYSWVTVSACRSYMNRESKIDKITKEIVDQLIHPVTCD